MAVTVKGEQPSVESNQGRGGFGWATVMAILSRGRGEPRRDRYGVYEVKEVDVISEGRVQTISTIVGGLFGIGRR